MAAAKLKLSPIAQWVNAAMLHRSMSQAELARELARHFRVDFDRSKVNKIVTDRRDVSAGEMLAIEEITGWPIPDGLRQGADLSSEDVAAGFEGKDKKAGIPLIAWVSAGKLADPSSQLPSRRMWASLIDDLGTGDYFATKVEGDSMDRYSPPGSTVIVDRNDKQLISGKCYIFGIDGKTTFKMYMAGTPPYLASHSTNPINPPIFMKRKSDVEIVGRVRRTMLDL